MPWWLPELRAADYRIAGLQPQHRGPIATELRRRGIELLEQQR
jgi:hypothetical protein